jgi:hypothetical protein
MSGCQTSDGFDLLDESEEDSEGELLESPKETVGDGGFVEIIGSEEREELKSCVIANGAKLIESATKITVSRVLDMEPSALLTLTPMGFLTQVAVSVGLDRVNGSKPTDYSMLVDMAEKHLEEGKQNFSPIQINTVQTWIDDARKRIQSMSLSIPKESEEKQQVKKDITFRTLLYGDSQSDVDWPLKNLLKALREFLKIPHRLIKTSRDKVEENIKRNPAIGCLEFSNNLETRAKTIAESVTNPSVKRTYICFGGPGTAKSTGCRLLAQWCGFPLIHLSGETFCRMCSKHVPTSKKITNFDIFSEWIAKEIVSLRVDGVPVMMGIILLDDFHLVMEGNGPFATVNEQSRTQFLQFMKNLGDSSQDTILSLELSADHVFPLNMTYIHLCITMNRVPEDMYAKADIALRSRIFNLGANYASDEDRLRMVGTVFWPMYKRGISEYLNIPEEKLNIDEKIALQEIKKVVQLDINITNDKFDGRNGIRGLCDLMEIYKQAIFSKLTCGEMPAEDLFKHVEFDGEKAVTGIEDYKKKTDSAINELDLQQAHEVKMESLRQQCNRLPEHQSDTFKVMLSTTCLINLELQMKRYQSRINLPSPQTIGVSLTRDFGYLKAEDGDDVDRFEPFKRVVESIYMRMSASRKGTCIKNEVIYVKPTSSQIDTSVYSNLGRLLGDVPVTMIQQPECILDQDLDPSMYHSGSHEIWKKLPQMQDILVSVNFLRERSFMYRLMNWGKFSFFVLVRPSEYGDVGILVHSSMFELVISAATNKTVLNLDTIICPEHYDSNTMNWYNYFVNRMKPKLVCISRLVENILHDERPSVDESLIVYCITPKIYEMLSAWASTMSGHEHMSPISHFIKHILNHLCLNYVSSRLGNMLDLRGITVFVLDLSGTCVNDIPKNTITWMPGVPPIRGRILHGRNFLKEQLQSVRSSLKDYMMAMKEDASELKEFTLSDSECKIVDALIKYDQELMELAKTHNLLEAVPITPLETCISTLLNRLKTRMMDIFELGVKPLSVESCKAFWDEVYKPYRMHIENHIRAKEEVERQKIEEERLKRQYDEKVIEFAAQREADRL